MVYTGLPTASTVSGSEDVDGLGVFTLHRAKRKKKIGSLES